MQQGLLGLNSRLQFGKSVIDGTYDLTQLNLTILQQLYFKEMKNTEQQLKKVKIKTILHTM